MRRRRWVLAVAPRRDVGDHEDVAGAGRLDVEYGTGDGYPLLVAARSDGEDPAAAAHIAAETVARMLEERKRAGS